MGVPIESLILPAVAAVACLGAIRLVPFGLWLAPALVVTWLLVGRTLALEARIHASPEGLDADDRTAVLVTILLVAFLGFTGVAAMVPGGLVQPAVGGGRRRCRRPTCCCSPSATPSSPSCWAIARRRCGCRPRDALWSALTYARRHRHRGGGAAGHGDPATHRARPC